MVHIANIGIDIITDFITVSLPSYESMVEIPHNLLSILSAMAIKCSIRGLVVPIGRPRYVNGRDSGLQSKIAAN